MKSLYLLGSYSVLVQAATAVQITLLSFCTGFKSYVRNSASHKTSQIYYIKIKDNQILNRFWFTLSEYEK